MNKLCTIILLLAAILSLSACQKDEHIMNPYTKAEPEKEVKPEPVQYVPGSLLVDGENFKMFGYEFIGSPIDPGDRGNVLRPEWLNLEEEEDGGMYAELMRFDDDETLKQHYRLDYEPIDWSKKTLLLAYGMRLYQDRPWSAHFEEKENGEYLLTVEIVPSFLTALNWWRVAVLVDKLDDNAVIELSTIN